MRVTLSVLDDFGLGASIVKTSCFQLSNQAEMFTVIDGMTFQFASHHSYDRYQAFSCLQRFVSARQAQYDNVKVYLNVFVTENRLETLVSGFWITIVEKQCYHGRCLTNRFGSYHRVFSTRFPHFRQNCKNIWHFDKSDHPSPSPKWHHHWNLNSLIFVKSQIWTRRKKIEMNVTLVCSIRFFSGWLVTIWFPEYILISHRALTNEQQHCKRSPSWKCNNEGANRIRNGARNIYIKFKFVATVPPFLCKMLAYYNIL